MRIRRVIFSAFLFGFTVAGYAAGTLGQFISENRKNLAQLEFGMSKEEVHSVMGREGVKNYGNPHRTAMTLDENDEPVEIFFY